MRSRSRCRHGRQMQMGGSHGFLLSHRTAGIWPLVRIRALPSWTYPPTGQPPLGRVRLLLPILPGVMIANCWRPALARTRIRGHSYAGSPRLKIHYISRTCTRSTIYISPGAGLFWLQKGTRLKSSLRILTAVPYWWLLPDRLRDRRCMTAGYLEPYSRQTDSAKS